MRISGKKGWAKIEASIHFFSRGQLAENAVAVAAAVAASCAAALQPQYRGRLACHGAYAEATANGIRNKRACATTAGARNQLVAHHAGAGAGANDSYAGSSAARARATGFVQPPHGTVDYRP